MKKFYSYLGPTPATKCFPLKFANKHVINSFVPIRFLWQFFIE